MPKHLLDQLKAAPPSEAQRNLVVLVSRTRVFGVEPRGRQSEHSVTLGYWSGSGDDKRVVEHFQFRSKTVLTRELLL